MKHKLRYHPNFANSINDTRKETVMSPWLCPEFPL